MLNQNRAYISIAEWRKRYAIAHAASDRTIAEREEKALIEGAYSAWLDGRMSDEKMSTILRVARKIDGIRNV